MNPRAALLSCCLSLPAFAATVLVEGIAGIDLKTAAVDRSEGADLRVAPMRLEARYGIRMEDGGQPFEGSAPLVIDRAFVVRDAHAAEYRLRVRLIAGDRRWIELMPVFDGAAKPFAGAFTVTASSLNGVPGNPSGFVLELLPDGTYRLGGARGRWELVGRRSLLSLDGYYAAWGRGEVSPDGRAVTFRFTRGTVEFEQVLTQQGEPPVASR
ncbi:MAG: hypothetical protein ACYC8T_37245 [Myxococcaceae bacterium]